MNDNAPFGLSPDTVSSVIRTKNKVLIGLGLIILGLGVYHFWF